MPGISMNRPSPHREVILAHNSDATVRVIESIDEDADDRSGKVPYTTDFHVIREKLASQSNFLQANLPHQKAGHGPPVFVLKGIHEQPKKVNPSSIAVEAWLAFIHHGIGKLPHHLYAMPPNEVWNVVGVGAEYGICHGSLDGLKPWFFKWYEQNC